MALILKNITYIDYKTLDFRQTDLLVNEGKSGGVELIDHLPTSEPDDENEIIDCTGKYATKSFAIGHHHIYSALSRGMPPPWQQPGNFSEVLEWVWWRLDRSLDKDMIRASAMSAALDAIRSGATFIIDHHASPNAIEGSLDIIAEVFDEAGIRHLLCYEISDRDGNTIAHRGLEETADYLSRRQGLIGLHASFTVSDDTMKEAAVLCEKLQSGVHIHVAEDQCDQEHCLKMHGKRVVERLHDFGFTHFPKSLFIHGLHLDDNEKTIIKNSEAWMVENIESNMNNNVGFFDGNGLGNRIFYGTDGMHGDMIRSAQSAFFAGRRFGNPDFEATYRNLRNVHRYLNQNHFDGDGDNNLILLDYNPPTPFDKNNFLGHFIYGLHAGFISDVIANGQFIFRNRRFTKINESEWLSFSRKQAQRLWEKLK